MKKRILKQIIVLLCAGLLPLCLVIPIITDISDQKLTMLPGITGQNIEPVTDALWNGTSTFEDFTFRENSLHVNYILRNSSYKYPNVFIIFWLDREKPFIDLSQYKYITLRIKNASPQHMTMFIKTFEQGISKSEHKNAHTLRHNKKDIYLSPSLDLYKININEFSTPRWWYDTFQTSEEHIGRETYKTVVSFDFQFIHTKSNPVLEEPRILTIEEIIFHKTIHPASICMTVLLIIYYIVFSTLYIRRRAKTRSKRKTLPTFKHLSYVNYREKELLRIKEYIRNNYNDPDISTKKIQAKTGISSVRIFNLIKDEYNCSFKQLINTMRIQKAESLIKESDLRIIEISYQIGFNDSTYFNKIFKQIAGITPTELRYNKEMHNIQAPVL